MTNNNNRGESHAPYNFVPLPEKVIYVEPPPSHDAFHNERHTGYIDVTLETRSPLYIRGPLIKEQFEQGGEGAEKNNPAFFHTGTPNIPVIPGSSLRGMLRNIFEVITYSKLQSVSNKQLFFRSVDNSSIGIAYRSRMVGNSEFGNKVEGGFLRRDKESGDYAILKCRVARVTRETIRYQSSGPNSTPPWEGTYFQHQVVWVRFGSKAHLIEQISANEQPGWSKAMLILTGNAPQKKKEFVFLFPETGAEEILVPDAIIERFHDDDQITQYQERAFPINKPRANGRTRKGNLETNSNNLGDPVFFLREESDKGERTLTFIGRAQMFRLPYTYTPLDFVPPEVRNPDRWDMTEAVFGRIPPKVKSSLEKRKSAGQAGRIFITDATLEDGQENNLWLPGVPASGFHPKILSTPKPTTFQHYLEQPENVTKNKLKHYEDKPDRRDLRLRGHKFYWHRGTQTQTTLSFTEDVEKFKTQLTLIRPLRAGLTFTFRVYFENLDNVELGALLWAIRLPHAQRDCCHSLGMGKPLGMGAVKLSADLTLTKRTERYATLFNNSGTDWEIPIRSINVAKLEAVFEEFIGTSVKTPFQTLCTTGRIADLLTLLEWKPELSALEKAEREYMTLEEFRYRPVLPTVRNMGKRR